jgi:hypothetical protein
MILRDSSEVEARVNFDILSEFDPTPNLTAGDDELFCHVLMITARLGIAIQIDEKDPARYKRVGHVCIHESWRYERHGQSPIGDGEKDLVISDFPDVQSVMLV